MSSSDYSINFPTLRNLPKYFSHFWTAPELKWSIPTFNRPLHNWSHWNPLRSCERNFRRIIYSRSTHLTWSAKIMAVRIVRLTRVGIRCCISINIQHVTSNSCVLNRLKFPQKMVKPTLQAFEFLALKRNGTLLILKHNLMKSWRGWEYFDDIIPKTKLNIWWNSFLWLNRNQKYCLQYFSYK